jgi:hypothetical protein
LFRSVALYPGKISSVDDDLSIHSQGPAPSPWAWVPADTPPLQQDPTSFSATFPQAPRIFPAAIPNSTRSSLFAHSTGPARSVHWPSDLDAPTTTWAAPPLDSYHSYPYGADFAPAASSRFSLGGLRGFSAGTGPGSAYPAAVPVPPSFSPVYPPSSDPSSPMTPQFREVNGLHTPRMPFERHSGPLSIPIVEPPHLARTVASPCIVPTPSQTESVVGSIRRTHLSTITESCTPSPPIPSPPSFRRTLPNGSSPPTSTIETFSTPSGLTVNPPGALRAGPVPTSRVRSEPLVFDSQMPQNWLNIMYPSGPSSTAPSIDGLTIPSPPRVELPPLRPVDSVRWSSLFPTAPVVVERPATVDGLTRVPSRDESNASLLSSPVRSVISYADSPGLSYTRIKVRSLLIVYVSTELSSPSEPMTPLSHTSGEPTSGTVPNRLTTSVVDVPREPDASAQPMAVATAASTTASNVPSNSMPSRSHLAVQLASSLFESIQRSFKVPASVDLSYNGFEVSFSTASVPWVGDSAAVTMLADVGGENDRAFEITPAPSNAVLHRYIKDLARVHMELIAMQAAENMSIDPALMQLELRIKSEQEATRRWMKCVCAAASALSIVDPAFSPKM